MMNVIYVAVLVLGGAGLVLMGSLMRSRGVGLWLIPRCRAHPGSGGRDVHLLLCIADHFEPYFNDATRAVADRRVEQWVNRYPSLFGSFRDSDDRPPRHTFFYPIDQYDPNHATALAQLCEEGYGEVEVHLHHHHDTASHLRTTLLDHRELMARRHGIGARDSATGQLKYAFIHGDWALDNSRPDGRCCGVNNELDVLRETGCYADLTMPSYPSRTQTRKVNSLYYAVDDPRRPKSHNQGVDVGRAPAPESSLMLIQGPLLANWRRRKWGVVPRIENGCVQANQPPSIERLELWLKARVQVPSRPDWYFVKLHTHGAPEANQSVLLGRGMLDFHEQLAQKAQADPHFHYHYLTARELYNLTRAAEAGWEGSVRDACNYELIWNPESNLEGSAEAGSARRDGRSEKGVEGGSAR